MKRYALKDKKIQQAIQGIDLLRKNYVLSLLIELGFSEQDAKTKTALFYKFLIGYHETIRYRKQPKNYVKEVMAEMAYFIQFD